MELFRRASGAPSRLAVFPGAFHPPTRAHLGLARAALSRVDQVLLVLPRAFPHKEFAEVSFDARLELLSAATAREPRWSLGSSDGGLFVEIARECRALYGPGPELLLLCGRDAAERIMEWDYGPAGASIAEMLTGFRLLVADRGGGYDPPAGLRRFVERLEIPTDLQQISATEVRARIRRGEAWRHLVPEEIAARVGELYG